MYIDPTPDSDYPSCGCDNYHSCRTCETPVGRHDREEREEREAQERHGTKVRGEYQKSEYERLAEIEAEAREEKFRKLCHEQFLRGGHKCPRCWKGTMVQRHGKHGAFWGCSDYPNCKETVSWYGDQPEQPPEIKIDISQFKPTPAPELKLKTYDQGFKDGYAKALADMAAAMKKLNGGAQ
jgi:ssDNA-binding Zn-finger/Zn-ribbon topoisomerase 1